MQINKVITGIAIFIIAVAFLPFISNPAFAHCDAMDGPVVTAAQKALETGNVNLVLIWVTKAAEAEIKTAFQKTLAVRKLSPEAKALSDMYFFETLVRVHRAGEGTPYTGLKPAGQDLGPAIPAVDKAIENESADALLKLIAATVEDGIIEKFEHALAKKHFDVNNVGAGREYVRAYVVFMHYAKGIYDAAKHASEGHFSQAEIGLHKD